jgi:4-hydroxybenzoate polyprenyltransferase
MLVAILRLVRVKNLLIVALTLYAMRFFILQPLLNQKQMSLQLGDFYFLLLVLSTVFITAAGYVINDYFDTRTDLVNRPSTVIVGKQVSRRFAIILHWSLNGLGVLFGLVVSYAIGKPFLTLVFFFIPGLLWFYSTSYKRQFLTGNILVAALTAMVPLMPLLFELPLLHKVYWQRLVFSSSVFNDIIYWTVGYATFAFILTLFREIVKDIEDVEGDNEFGSRSLPVVLGVTNARNVGAGVLFATIVVLAYLFGAYLNFLANGKFDYFTFVYMILGLVIPIFILIVKLLNAKGKEDYHWVSSFSKLVMLIGILYAMPFRFFIV